MRAVGATPFRGSQQSGHIVSSTAGGRAGRSCAPLTGRSLEEGAGVSCTVMGREVEILVVGKEHVLAVRAFAGPLPVQGMWSWYLGSSQMLALTTEGCFPLNAEPCLDPGCWSRN